MTYPELKLQGTWSNLEANLKKLAVLSISGGTRSVFKAETWLKEVSCSFLSNK